MVTVFRAHGLRVVIFVDDHEPAHVHVFGDGEAKIDLLGKGGIPELIRVDRMTRGEVRWASGSWLSSRRCCCNGGRIFMAELTDAQIDDAARRGRFARLQEPRAKAARYDAQTSQTIVELTNACIFTFPGRLPQGLEEATDTQLAAVEIFGAGTGLHWEDLDVDLSIQGLLAGLFGTRAFMARKAGQAKSPAKAEAARANGAKGGRPRKLASMA